jgi:ribosomal protein L34
MQNKQVGYVGREAPTKGWRLLTTARARGRSDLGDASSHTSGRSELHVLLF